MNPHEPVRSAGPNLDVDSLLREFFRQEMPAELSRRPDTALNLVPAPLPERPGATGTLTRTSRTIRSARAVIGLAVVCLLLVAATLALLPPHAARDALSVAESPSQRPTTEQPNGAEAKVDRPGVAPDQNAPLAGNPSDQMPPYGTMTGPAELQPRLPIEDVSGTDPQSDPRVEPILPELEIEIFPIDDEQKPARSP